MPYVNVLKENLSLKALAAKCLKLVPYTALASLKLWALFVLFDSFSALMFLSFQKSAGTQLFLCVSSAATLFCVAVNYILACSAVKVMQDGVNGAAQDVLGAIVVALKRIIALSSSALLIGAATYFLFSPGAYLRENFKDWYFLLVSAVYVCFFPYIIFHPWKIILEDKTVFESFWASYHLVRKHWLKCALLFLLSGIITAFLVFAALGVLTAFTLWFNWEAFSFLKRLNLSLGADMPSNIKTAVMLAELGPFGLRTAVSLTVFACFASYSVLFGFNIFLLILTLSYKTLKAYNLMAENPPEPEHKKTVEEERDDLAALFKDVKEITINPGDDDTFEETSALGHLDRREALRRFNKEDEDTANYGRIKPVIHEYPDPDNRGNENP